MTPEEKKDLKEYFEDVSIPWEQKKDLAQETLSKLLAPDIVYIVTQGSFGFRVYNGTHKETAFSSTKDSDIHHHLEVWVEGNLAQVWEASAGEEFQLKRNVVEELELRLVESNKLIENEQEVVKKAETLLQKINVFEDMRAEV